MSKMGRTFAQENFFSNEIAYFLLKLSKNSSFACAILFLRIFVAQSGCTKFCINRWKMLEL